MRATEFVAEYKKYPTVDYEGVTFTMIEKDGQLIVKALNDYGNAMGYVIFNMDGKELDPQDLQVDNKYQGQGIARVMYDYIKSRGFTINRSWDQTDAGAGFWNKHRGEDERVWEDRGQGAAGIILYAEDTGRYGLQQRSDDINDPGMWAAWGGGREPGESLEQCARRELGEESGYTGPIKLHHLASNPKYTTFIGVVPHEFEPRANDEWKDYCWVELEDWPSPMHPGVAAALENIAVNEAFDQPYKTKTEKSDYGDVDMLARLPDGTNLSIMFNKQQNNEGEETIQVEFYRNNSQEVTGEGDAQKIFATVLTSIQKYIKKYKPARLSFSASKATDPTIYYEPDQPQPNPESRAKLYDRLVQRYARAWGYRAFRADTGDLVIYELNRLQPAMSENFADGKNPGRKGLAKRSGVNTKASVSDLRKTAKNSSGEKQRMAHWLANMKAGRAKARKK